LELCDAVAYQARYATSDRRGETRRERNARFKVDSPVLDLPERGVYIWHWFFDASPSRRFINGHPATITPSEWLAWAQITGEIIRPEEWAVLRDMDASYVNALQAELSDQHIREGEANGARRSNTGYQS